MQFRQVDALLVLGAAGLVFLGWLAVFNPPFDVAAYEARMEKEQSEALLSIRPGMSPSQVEAALGRDWKVAKTLTVGQGRVVVYKGACRSITVAFGPDGLVLRADRGDVTRG